MRLLDALRTPARAGAFCALAWTAAACGDAGPVSGPGTLTATLVSPNGAEGAARVFLVGEGIGEVSAPGGRVFSFQQGDTTHVVLVHEGGAGGTLGFSVAVADTTRSIQGVVVEVSDPDDRIRDLTWYVLEIRR